MTWREFRAIHGGANNRNAINRAVRKEMAGGAQALETADHLDYLRQRWIERGWHDGLPEINKALSAATSLCREMRAEIRRRYGLPPEAD